MKIVAFIPVKLSNERFEGKNTKPFYDGRPLISFIMESLRKLHRLDEIYVYCSQEIISNYLSSGIYFLKRPDYLDLPSTTPQDIICEFMKQVDADIYMVSHTTSPMVSVESLQACIDAVASGEFDSAFTARKLQHLLWTDKKEPVNFDSTNIPRTQDLPPLFAEVSAAYVFTKELYKKEKCRIGGNIKIVEVSEIESIDIDYEESYRMADAIYRYMCEGKKSL